MGASNWPIERFGVDQLKAIPNSRNTVAGNPTTFPSMIQLPDSSIATAPTVITVGGTHIVQANDSGDILVNVNAPVTIQLPPAALRGLYPISVIDIGGFAKAQPITITAVLTDKIIGSTTYVLRTNYEGITLWAATQQALWYLK